MVGFIENILSRVIDIINSLGYLGIAIGMLLESACIPLPSEIVLPLGGNMVSSVKSTSLLGVNIAAALGSMSGSLLAYLVGCYGGRSFILKYGKYFFVSEKHFYQAEKVFNKYGTAAVFFGRLLPIIRTFISLPAGIAKMDIKKFLTYSFVGMLPWNFILIYLGYRLGKDFNKIVDPIYQKFQLVVILAIAAVILIFAAKHLFKKKRGNGIS